MKISIEPGKLNGKVNINPSKSYAHRQLIAAALSHLDTVINIDSLNDDIEATIECLKCLGAEISKQKGCLLVKPVWGNLNDGALLNCRESGSTLRFLMPILPALRCESTINAQGRLPQRPNSVLIEQLRAHNVTVDNELLPFKISGKLESGIFEIPGNVSSQYITGLMFALPLLDNASKIYVTSKLESRNYLDITIEVLNEFGVLIEETDYGFYISAPQEYKTPQNITVEGDWSSASFWLTANLLGSNIEVNCLNDNSKQGDRAINKILNEFKDRTGKLKGIDIDASDIPDLVPILAVAATQAEGKTVITNAARLRIKESDRLNAICSSLRILGADIAETEDGLVVNGGKRLKGGTVSSFGDHRIAMSMAIAATVSDGPVIIDGAESVNKSYPEFFAEFKNLGGKLNV